MSPKPTNPLERPANSDRLHCLHEQGVLSLEQLTQALALATRTPSEAEWSSALSPLLLLAGGGLICGAVGLFLASEWSSLAPLARHGAWVMWVRGAWDIVARYVGGLVWGAP